MPGGLETKNRVFVSVALRAFSEWKATEDLAPSVMVLAPGLAIVALVTLGAMELHALLPPISIGLLSVRFSIVLPGLQISAGQIASLGVEVLLAVIFTLMATLLATVQFGKILGVDSKLTRLLAAGTAVCGASAVLAANEVVEGAGKDAAYAACMVTIFGTVAMFLFPLIGQASSVKKSEPSD